MSSQTQRPKGFGSRTDKRFPRLVTCIGLIMAVVLVGTARAGDIPFIRVLGPAATQPAINDLGEVVYVERATELYSTERGLLANFVDASNLGIANDGEVVYGSHNQVMSTTRGTLGPVGSCCPTIAPTTGEVVYLFNGQVFSTTRGQLTFLDTSIEHVGVADVNDLGEVVFERRTSPGGFNRIFSTTRGFLTPPGTSAIQPAISNSGEVVYSGRDSENRQQIVSTVRGHLTSFGGSVSVFTADLPDIDSFGNVIFRANIGGDDGGIFLLPAAPIITAVGGERQECTMEGGSTVDFTANGPLLPPGVSITNIDWFLDGASIGSGETLSAFIPLGQHKIEAAATTSEGDTRTGASPIEIVDTTEPDIVISFSDVSGQPITGIARNGLNRVIVGFHATDVCDPEPSTTANGGVSITSGEVVEILPARGQITLTGENFAATVTATDASGNVAQEDAVLPVVE